MIDYLKKYNLTDDDLQEIDKKFNKDIKEKFAVMQDNVREVLDYLLELGVSNFKSLILLRPDICFMNVLVLKEKIEKIDSNLIGFVIEKDAQSLINFDI
jgi:hypothetical protein